MTRTELEALLADLVARRAITVSEAERLLTQFDEGDLRQADLPLSIAPQDDNDSWLALFALLLLLMRGNVNARLAITKRILARDLLRGAFEREVAQLATLVANGQITPSLWQGGMQQAIANYTRQMAIAGGGTLPNAATRAAVEAMLAEQWEPLQRFTGQLVANQRGMGRILSERAIVARAKLYGNVGWRAFYEGQGASLGYGWVEQYITRDDGYVCPACAPRHMNYYLPGQGPMPGYSFCYGTCRCVRRAVYEPGIYAQLTGRRAA